MDTGREAIHQLKSFSNLAHLFYHYRGLLSSFFLIFLKFFFCSLSNARSQALALS